MATFLVVLLIGLSVVLMICLMRQGTPTPAAYFFSLQDGSLVVLSDDQLPPVALEGGGGQAVAAMVFSCGECSASEQRVVYLVSYTDEAKQLLHTHGGRVPEEFEAKLERGRLIAAPVSGGESPQWVSAADAAAQKLVGRPRTLCNGAPAKVCLPDPLSQ